MPHALLSPVALGLELPPDTNLFQRCIAGSLTSATGPVVLIGAHPCHSSTSDVVSLAPPWRSRVWQHRSDKAIVDSHTRRSLSGSLAEQTTQWHGRVALSIGGGGSPGSVASSFLQVACILLCRKGCVAPYHGSNISHRHTTPNWVGNRENVPGHDLDDDETGSC